MPMLATCLEKTLLEKLNSLPELSASGFVARAGLTGNGVTLLKGRSYFGAWRRTYSAFVWTYANISEDPYHAASLDDAILHTMKMVLSALQTSKVLRGAAARPELNRTA